MGGRLKLHKSGWVELQNYLSVFMINHYVVWFDISVHYPHTVTIVKSLQVIGRTFRFHCLIDNFEQITRIHLESAQV